MARDSELGSVSLECSFPLVAGELTTVIVRYAVGKVGVAVGGKIRIGIPNAGWGEPHVPFPRYWDEALTGKKRMFVPYKRINTTGSLKSKGQANLFLTAQERMMAPEANAAIGYWRWWITALVEEDSLRKGDIVELTYGNPTYGEAGVLIQRFPEENVSFLAYVDVKGDGRFVEVPGSPMLVSVVAGDPARLNVIGPSIVKPKEPFTIRASATDKCHCRPSTPFVGRLTARTEGRGRPCVKRLAASSNNSCAFDGIRIEHAGHVRAKVGDEAGKITGTSNPILCAKNKPNLYWGDLHGQSEYHVFNAQARPYHGHERKGISTGSYDDCYRYARDVALLDFLAMTDQGAPLSDAWELCQRKVREYYEPGRFVTFKGFEAGTDVGHRNAVYATDEVEPKFDPREFSPMPDRIYHFFRGREDVILIPHHTKVWTNWEYHDRDLEPIAEVYSCWGSSEKAGLDHWAKGMTPGGGLQEALRRGYRLGIIASSDNHAGMPGRSLANADRQFCTGMKGGLAAIYAHDLTREALFNSLRSRWCYGTTGARIILEFFINGVRMGEEIAVSDPREDRTIKVHVIGTDKIKNVVIVKNNADWLTANGESDIMRLKQVDMSPVRRTDFYYVRVTQEDDEMAWSSPIWVSVNSKGRISRKRK